MTIELADEQSNGQDYEITPGKHLDDFDAEEDMPQEQPDYDYLPDPLSAADYQSLHARAVEDILEYTEYVLDIRTECTRLYDLCDKDYPEDCIPEFVTLNRRRSELRKARAHLKHLHRANTYFKRMAKATSY